MNDYTKLIKESLDSEIALSKQYKKEYNDAINGTGLCAGMSAAQRKSVASMLSESIKNTEVAIKEYEQQIKEMEEK